MGKLAFLTIVAGTALAFSATEASASVNIGSTGSFCSTAGCTPGTSTATVTDNLSFPNKLEFDDTNPSSGSQTAWFNFYVNPDMLGTFSATVATSPGSTVTLLELLTGGNDLTAGTTVVTSTPGTQLTWGNLTANTWYTFRYTADLSTGGNISGNGTFYPAVPEPATWGLMLLGFGGIGFAMRRRRRPALAQLV